jgi:hypothetical protein
MEKRFIVCNLGYPTVYLGIQITKTDCGKMILSQSKKIKTLVDELGIKASNLCMSPIPPLASHKNMKINSKVMSYSYREIIGKLLHIANYTRPDIAFAVCFLARYQASPLDLHWTLLSHLLKYLANTVDIGLVYHCSGLNMDAFVDADYAGDPKTSRSTTGYIVRYYGCPIAWASKVQSCIAKSSGEAENIAICEAAHTILFIASLTEEILGVELYPITVYEDSNAAISFNINKTSKSRMRHVKLKYLKVKEYVENKVLHLVKIESKNQLADCLTKGLANENFLEQRKSLMTA